MCENFSYIWIELDVTGSEKKILVSNVYRDHQWMKQGADKSSKSDEAVMDRWQKYLRQWKRTLDSGAEVHCLGDFNLDSARLHGNCGQQQQQPLVDALLHQVVPVTQWLLGSLAATSTESWTGQTWRLSGASSSGTSTPAGCRRGQRP